VDNTTIIANLLSLAAAAIPLVIAVLTILNSRNESRKQPIDTSLKIVGIYRVPLEEQDWKKQKSVYKRRNILSWIGVVVLALVFIIVISIRFYRSTPPLLAFIMPIFQLPIFLFFISVSSYISFFLFISLVFSIIAILLVVRRTRLSLGANAEEGRFYRFKQAKIFVEASYEDLVSKCQEALKDSGAQAIEIKPEEEITTIKGSIVNSLFAPSGIIAVQIHPSEEADDNSGSPPSGIQVHPSENEEKSFDLEIEFIPLKERKEWVCIQERSRLINRFIRRFVTKPDSTNAKGQGNA